METSRFLRLREIFDRAVQLPTSQWDECVVRECAGDSDLLAEARQLLDAHRRAGDSEGGHGSADTSTKTIGPYRILHKIGEGGMGVVYVAVRDDGTFRKNVAVKVLRSNQISNDLVQRFHQERQVLASLDHPNIARILDGGQTSDGLPYYVMEFVEGLALDKFCDSRKLDIPDRIRLFQQVIYAVHYLHENLVIHRDLKHSNILVTSDGVVKLLDFGIAKIRGPMMPASDLTGPDQRLLTPNYASPEQITGGSMTRASDIYSLGVIIYHLLTGQLPHADPLSKLSHDPPPPSASIREDLQRTPETTAQLRRRIVGDLDHIVLMCLNRDPRRRYETATKLGDDLQCFLEGKSVAARKAPIIEWAVRIMKRNRIAVGVAAVVLLSCTAGGWQMVRAQHQMHLVQAREDAIKNLIDTLSQRSNSVPAAPVNARAGGRTSVSPRAEDVRQLRTALSRDLAPTWSTHPGNKQERRALLERSKTYLDNVRAHAAQDATLAVELAGAYQELGLLYEPLYRDSALSAFSTAATVLSNTPGLNPDDSAYKAQWMFLSGRIRALGGSMPVLVAAAQPVAPPTAATRPERVQSAPQTPSIRSLPSPSTQPAMDRAEYEDVKARLMSAITKGQIAEDLMGDLKNNASKLHQPLHPDITSNFTRMKLALDAAQKELNDGDLAAVRESIGIADACATRVMRAGGR